VIGEHLVEHEPVEAHVGGEFDRLRIVDVDAERGFVVLDARFERIFERSGYRRPFGHDQP
jgi:hypothetical protein